MVVENGLTANTGRFRGRSVSVPHILDIYKQRRNSHTEKDKVFGAQNGQRNPRLSISNISNLANFYINEGLETITENGLGKSMPTIIIDHHKSDPDIGKTLNASTLESSAHRKENNNSEIITQLDQQSNNKESSLVQYLSPPSFRRKRVPSDASVSSAQTDPRSVRSNRSDRLQISHVKLRSAPRDDDAISIGGCSLGPTMDDSLDAELGDAAMDTRLIKFLSVMYALLIIVVGAIVSMMDLNNDANNINHLFIIITTLMGFVWVVFLHWDIQKYKKWAVEFLKPDRGRSKDSISQRSTSDLDDISISTAVVFNTYKKPIADDETNASTASPFESAYRFLHGKHSGNFYLKCGMTVFCFGSIIHQGVNLVQQIHYFIDGIHKCQNAITLIFHTIRCLFSFYQLFIVFKYSNILINRYKTLARFALMHLVGSSISYWISTIIEEAIEDYVAKIEAMHTKINGTTDTPDYVIDSDVLFSEEVSHHIYCADKSIVNMKSLEALPYLYPFTIEYNIILASVWYIVWTNVGKDDVNAFSHHIRREISENEFGEEEIQYKSTVAINADCHASNRGLFGGLSILLLVFITIIVFFTTINQDSYSDFGVGIYSAQLGVLTLLCSIVLPLGYKQIRKLDTVGDHHLDNSSTAMDDFLVLIPLPFYFIHHILSSVAAANYPSPNNIFLVIINLLAMVQVSIQSPVIVDGIRRCSNNKKHRFKKPGRELVTFALILNITLWILNTFELKLVDSYHGNQDYFGKFNWMIISHATLPFILFYRFHSSVCLSDIWKYAYEKDDHHII